MLKKTIKLIKSNPFFSPLLFLIDLFLFSIDLFATIGFRKKNPNKICIIKLDKLGDYVLIRNFFYRLRETDQYKNYKFSFIGNKENQKFAEYLDAGLFDKIIWVDIYKYASHPFYRFAISREIYREGFQIAIVPTYGRVLVLDDFVAFATRAAVRIGQHPHSVNIKKWEIKIGNGCYTQLIHVSDDIIFEFERNKLFFEKLTGEDFSNIEPKINYSPPKHQDQGQHVIFLPGAADKHRQWSSKNFAAVADWLTKEKKCRIILCGSPSEYQVGVDISNYSLQPNNIENPIGLLTVPDLFGLLHDAKFILSNETGAVHICAALGKTVFCISNGNHFKKYTEYPPRLKKNVYYIYPAEVETLMKSSYEQAARKYDFKSDLDIDSISPQKVINSIYSFFFNKNSDLKEADHEWRNRTKEQS